MEENVLCQEEIVRFRSPRRQWVESLLRHLGCQCPPEVFDDIRLRDLAGEGFTITWEIGQRLLVGIVDGNHSEQIVDLLERGRSYRDSRRLNRFRLVLLGTSGQDLWPEAVQDVLKADPQAHVHGISLAWLRRLMAAEDPVGDAGSAEPDVP